MEHIISNTNLLSNLNFKKVKLNLNKFYFRKQYRLAMLTRNLDKMSDEKLNGHLRIAEEFISNLY